MSASASRSAASSAGGRPPPPPPPPPHPFPFTGALEGGSESHCSLRLTLMARASPAAAMNLATSSPQLVDNVAKLLRMLRPLSFQAALLKR